MTSSLTKSGAVLAALLIGQNALAIENAKLPGKIAPPLAAPKLPETALPAGAPGASVLPQLKLESPQAPIGGTPAAAKPAVDPQAPLMNPDASDEQSASQ